jgi:DNA-binding beta-propeller fold protein YncE
MPARSRAVHAALGAIALALATVAGGCGSSAPGRSVRRAAAGHATGRARRSGAASGLDAAGRRAGPERPQRTTPRLVALVTDPSGNRLLVVSVPGIQLLRTVAVPGEPEYVAGTDADGPVAVVSAGSASIRLLSGPRLLGIRVPGQLVAPHVTALAPGGEFVYVTDDGSGRADVIGLARRRIASRRFIGLGAHHLAFNPGGSQVWVVLGQSAHTVAILSTASRPPSGVTGGNWVNPARPRVVAHLDPGYRAHDIKFTPDGRSVWITSASGPTIGVFDARTHRLRLRIPAGAPPQHVVFGGSFAYVTSGYGSTIEQIRWRTGRVMRRVRAPYGSFELDAAGPYVVTSSLLRGTVAVYDRNLGLLRVRRVGATAEDIALVRP